MMRVLLPVFLCFFAACDGPPAPPAKPTSEAVNTEKSGAHFVAADVEELSGDFMKWYRYTYRHIRLAQDFIPLDNDSTLLEKTDFLKRLGTGGFIVTRAATAQKKPAYRLRRLRTPNTDIRNEMMAMASTALRLQRMEGRQLPAYRFSDLNGEAYTPASTRGKLLLVKCWFINCVACVQEFPELNRLVAAYGKRPDVLFLSLASDSREALVPFLKKRPFSYAVVPDAGTYMEDQLAVNAYPLHLLVNVDGVVVKATNAIEDLLPAFEELAGTETARL